MSLRESVSHSTQTSLLSKGFRKDLTLCLGELQEVQYLRSQ